MESGVKITADRCGWFPWARREESCRFWKRWMSEVVLESIAWGRTPKELGPIKTGTGASTSGVWDQAKRGESLWRTSLPNFPPFEADRGAGETWPPRGGAMSDSKGAPSPTAAWGAAMGSEDLVGFHLKMVYFMCVNFTSLKKKKKRLSGEDLTLLRN